MRWRGGRRSVNIEDRRGMGRPAGMRLPGGRGFRIPMGRGGRRGGGLGIVGLLVVVGIALLFGFDPGILSGGGGGGLTGAPTTRLAPEQEAELEEMSAVVLANTEDTWRALFSQMGETYQDPTLVLFSGAVESACGSAQSAMGPFYCPADDRVYLDLSFFQDLQTRFQAAGDFAQAYVIAHEVGHHVQNLLGISGRVHEMRQGAGEAEANELSVRLELQADCFAGVWGYHAGQEEFLEAGDLEEALNAASAIGDDRLQMQTQGRVVPDAFTHGSSEQRVRWFRQGFETGDVETCNTFDAADL